jgi:hypothetical protein
MMSLLEGFRESKAGAEVFEVGFNVGRVRAEVRLNRVGHLGRVVGDRVEHVLFVGAARGTGWALRSARSLLPLRSARASWPACEPLGPSGPFGAWHAGDTLRPDWSALEDHRAGCRAHRARQQGDCHE